MRVAEGLAVGEKKFRTDSYPSGPRLQHFAVRARRGPNSPSFFILKTETPEKGRLFPLQPRQSSYGGADPEALRLWRSRP